MLLNIETKYAKVKYDLCVYSKREITNWIHDYEFTPKEPNISFLSVEKGTIGRKMIDIPLKRVMFRVNQPLQDMEEKKYSPENLIPNFKRQIAQKLNELFELYGVQKI